MVASSAASSRAQPCTSPMANTVSPLTSNGAAVQGPTSTGSVTGVSMPGMLDLSGAALHRGRTGLGRAAIELFLEPAIEIEAHGHLLTAVDPYVRRQQVVAVAYAFYADVGGPHDPLVLRDQFLQPRDRRADLLAGRALEAQLDTDGVVSRRHAHDLAP